MRISGSATTRNLVGPLLRGMFRIRITGAHRVPLRGGLLLVANHDGIADATLLATASPRPVRVVSEGGVLPAAWQRLSGATGRIVVADESAAESAIREAVARLFASEAVGMFPEGPLVARAATGRSTLPGAGYVQVRSGVPVLPVALLGTHGARPTDPPRPRAEIDLVFGDPFLPEAPADPFSRAGILGVAEEIRQRLADHVAVARARTARADVPSIDGAREDGAS